MQMFNSEYLQEKWAPILDYDGLDPIKDSHRRSVTAVLLENQEKELREERNFLSEAPNVNTNSGATAGFSADATAAGPVAGFDPVLISLIRRSMPNLVAYDLAGVQPMNGPTGLIFAMRSRYKTQSGTEALFNEADTAFSGQPDGLDDTSGFTATGANNVGLGTTAQQGSNPGLLNSTAAQTNATDYNVGQGMRTDSAEDLGDGTGDQFNQMAFSIEKVTVTAKSRALKAEYSLELAQDLKAIHGLNAEAELANILSTEILAEINREVIRTIYNVAEPGAQANVAAAGTFDLDTDSNGRWSVEKFKGLIFQIERDANAIAQRTRRGKGNMILCSADVASALTMAGVLDYTPALNANLNVDDTGNTFAGILQGKYRVYIDPFSASGGAAATQYYVVGYKGSSPYDAGLFYCPYVPLQMVRAVGQDTFQPKIGFKTRYGLVENPFSQGTTQGLGTLTRNSNRYYRRVKVANLM
ncbi:precursor of major head subunit [Prochlorococcus phage P-SSM2]|uniref:Precursor of major head subunit n=3 Tax=Salacisavirus pssm2 TaxID=2734140 RepID=Q58ML9_BPPRM|nr:precursor of major head subunit [Prochlorococcus phage P-SSM2]AAX44513.1 precursor of major head subunit [Prochlorococcus phage P-SSM2]